ncbi:MAG: glycosyltransferase family 4 protein [Candidatus Thermoplasmatota archaeon]|nr:glycosyltransferase family 4 protein [Candidatus Thermoplasmatota archaeon]
MNVAIVVWHLDVKGGTQRQALELARHLKSKGDEVTLYCAHLDRDSCYSELLEGLEIVSLHGSSRQRHMGKLRWISYPVEPLFVGDERRLARMIGHHDVINCHEHRAYRTACFHRKASGTPIVWMMNDLPASFKKPRRPRNLNAVKDLAHYLLIGGLIGRWVDLRRVKTIDRIVVLDRLNHGLLLNNTGMTSTVIRSGLDLAKFGFVERSAAEATGPFTIFTIGIFFPHRRFEDMVSALGILKKDGRDVRLRLAGLESKDRVYSARVRALVRSLELEDRVEFLGAISEEQLVREYSTADAFAFPHSPQTWGLVVFEAMASGVPVIVSRGCGASEMLVDGDTAMLVEPARPDGFATAIRKLMDDPSLRNMLSVSGRRFVEGNIRWDLYADKMMDEFTRVCGNKERWP